MKSFSIKIFSFVLMCLLTMGLMSCEESFERIEIYSSVFGNAIANPSTVENGDEIELSIGGSVAGSDETTINGKEYHPVVHYLIDEKEVATSSEKEIPFSAKYKVENLSIGEHVLSVRISSSRSGAFYENKVATSVISVVE